MTLLFSLLVEQTRVFTFVLGQRLIISLINSFSPSLLSQREISNESERGQQWIYDMKLSAAQTRSRVCSTNKLNNNVILALLVSG